MRGKRPSIDEVLDLRDQGFEPSLELDRDEAISRGWIIPETEKTRLVQYRGEVIEIDFRKQVSSDGQRIVWIQGQNPKFLEARDKGRAEYNKLRGDKRGKRKKSIGSIIRKFMDAPVTKRELGKLPGGVQKALEEFMGGELTRGDVAAFALMGRAMEGDIMAFKEIADRVEGKAIQRTENKNMNVNYTDFLKDKAGLLDDEDEEDFVDV